MRLIICLNNNITFLLPMLAAVTMLPLVSHGQVPGGGAQTKSGNGPEFEQKLCSAVVRREGISTQVMSFLKNEELVIGKNKKTDGTDFFVADGRAEISGNRSSKDWPASRAVAFEKALNAAKDKILAQIVTEVETKVAQHQLEGTAGVAANNKSDSSPSLFCKMVDLSENKIKEFQKKSNSSTEDLTKVMRTEEFKSFVRLTSRAMVSGVTAFQTFEDLSSGRNGEISVIGIVSDKTLALAASVGSGTPLPKGMPSKPINEQIPDDKTEDGALQLLNSYGTKTMYDENGELVIVSFNQATPVNETTGAEISAQRRAGTFAVKEIRQFLGEQIARVEDAYRSETIKDFEDNTRQTEATEGSAFKYEALAKNISITGITTVKEWIARHPVTGHTIVGSIKMWSPSNQAFAGMLRGKMAQAATVAAKPKPENSSAQSNNKRKPINSDQAGELKGFGIKGSKDGF